MYVCAWSGFSQTGEGRDPANVGGPPEEAAGHCKEGYDNLHCEHIVHTANNNCRETYSSPNGSYTVLMFWHLSSDARPLYVEVRVCVCVSTDVAACGSAPSCRSHLGTKLPVCWLQGVCERSVPLPGPSGGHGGCFPLVVPPTLSSHFLYRHPRCVSPLPAAASHDSPAPVPSSVAPPTSCMEWTEYAL